MIFFIFIFCIAALHLFRQHYRALLGRFYIWSMAYAFIGVIAFSGIVGLGQKEVFADDDSCAPWFAKKGYNCNSNLMEIYGIIRERLRGKIEPSSVDKGQMGYRISISSFSKGLFSSGWNNFFDQIYKADKFVNYEGADNCKKGAPGYINISNNWSNLEVGLCLVRISPDSDHPKLNMKAASSWAFQCGKEKRSCICAYTQNNSIYSDRPVDILGCVDEEFAGAQFFLNSFIAPPPLAVFLQQCRGGGDSGCTYEAWTKWFKNAGIGSSSFEKPKADMGRASSSNANIANSELTLDLSKNPLFSFQKSSDSAGEAVENLSEFLARNQRSPVCETFEPQDQYAYCGRLNEQLSAICVYKVAKGNNEMPILDYGCVARPGLLQSSEWTLLAVAQPFLAGDDSVYNGVLPLMVNAKPGQTIATDDDGEGLVIKEIGERVFALIRKSSIGDGEIKKFAPARCSIWVDKVKSSLDLRAPCKLSDGIEVKIPDLYVFSHLRNYYTKINPELEVDGKVLGKYLPKTLKNASLREFFESKDLVFQPYTRDLAMLTEYGMFITPIMPKLKDSKEQKEMFEWNFYNINTAELGNEDDKCMSFEAVKNSESKLRETTTKYIPAAGAVRERSWCDQSRWQQVAANKAKLDALSGSQKVLATNIMRHNILCKDNERDDDFAISPGMYQGEFKRDKDDKKDADIIAQAAKLTSDKRLICLASEANDWDFISGGQVNAMPRALVCDYLPAQCPVLKQAVANSGNAVWLQSTLFSSVGQGDCDNSKFEAEIDLSLDKMNQGGGDDNLNLSFEQAQKALMDLKSKAQKEGRNVRKSEVEAEMALSGFADKIRCEVKKPSGVCTGYSYAQVKHPCVTKDAAEPSFDCQK